MIVRFNPGRKLEGFGKSSQTLQSAEEFQKKGCLTRTFQSGLASYVSKLTCKGFCNKTLETWQIHDLIKTKRLT